MEFLRAPSLKHVCPKIHPIVFLCASVQGWQMSVLCTLLDTGIASGDSHRMGQKLILQDS